ncbi:hypothetical protein [Streptomyces sp. MP131-18]|uniref:hypothetical protein n=1 Tax=Streptomyces sp. MP131-18 TaxID=1857892 RepID=UPI00097BC5DA|nr:hypothetical protein [Streptomyces sp. MP131-18]ONK11090.1 hypothetical protein STBA_18180 [Streptomyces sp. MP131-18]
MYDGADLSVNSEELGPVESAARELYELLPSKGLAAEPESQDTGAGLARHGIASGTALTGLTETWRTRITSLQNDCARISGHLDGTIVSHSDLEHRIGNDLRAVQPNYALLAAEGIGPASLEREA